MARIKITSSGLALGDHVAAVDWHRWVATELTYAPGDLRMTFESYYRGITLKDGITSEDLRTGNDGLGNLQIEVLDQGLVVETITVADFEDGKTITGRAKTGPFGGFYFGIEPGSSTWIRPAPSDGTTVGLAITSTGEVIFVEADITVTYFLETLVIGGQSFNLRGGVPVWGSAAGERLMGFDVNDATGRAYADRIEGRGGDDQLFGQAGADTLEGGAGSDVLFGGHGNDTYLLTAIEDWDNLNEERAEGLDTIRLADVAPGDLRFWIDQSTAWFVVPDGAGGWRVLATASGFDPVTGRQDISARFEFVAFDDGTIWDLRRGLRMTGSDDGQRIEGQQTADRIEGRGGHDDLRGHGGADTLIGGAGADVLDGGAGNDLLLGDAGPDVLTGGAGADLFRFARAGHANFDAISDFRSGVDRIDLSALGLTDFIGGADFHNRAGELRYDRATSQLAADSDGDGEADWAISLSMQPVLRETDLLL